MKNAKFTLGGVEYTAPPATLGQIEQLSELWDRQAAAPDAPGKTTARQFRDTLDMAAVLFSDVEPKIEDIRKLRCHPSELRAAVTACALASGLTQGEASAAAAAA